ncbi:MAG: hypothetical protein E7638_07805 [Ruminococcaceae bacterium]|nr:hypothetical protein [Oscillospiraceae bacterium]
MRYYRRKRYENGRAKKVFFRILFVLAAAIIITVAASFAGNRVKKMVEEAQREIDSAETTDAASAKKDSHYTTPLLSAPISVRALGIDPFGDEDAAGQMSDMKDSFDTVSVNLRNDGTLIYLSPAVMEFLGLPTTDITSDGTSSAYERLRSFCTAVKKENLRLSAVLEPTHGDGDSFFPDCDKELVKELTELGFDEVIFTGFDALTDEAADYILSLCDNVIRVGAVFPYEVYMDGRNEKPLRLLSASGVILCADPGADVRERAAETVKEQCTEIRNAAGLYHLRFFLATEDEAILSEQYKALCASDIENIQIAPAVSPDVLTGAALAETQIPETEAKEETTSPVNPYITTTVETTEEGEVIPEEDEIFRGDGSWY